MSILFLCILRVSVQRARVELLKNLQCSVSLPVFDLAFMPFIKILSNGAYLRPSRNLSPFSSRPGNFVQECFLIPLIPRAINNVMFTESNDALSQCHPSPHSFELPRPLYAGRSTAVKKSPESFHFSLPQQLNT